MTRWLQGCHVEHGPPGCIQSPTVQIHSHLQREITEADSNGILGFGFQVTVTVHIILQYTFPLD